MSAPETKPDPKAVQAGKTFAEKLKAHAQMKTDLGKIDELLREAKALQGDKGLDGID